MAVTLVNIQAKAFKLDYSGVTLPSPKVPVWPVLTPFSPNPPTETVKIRTVMSACTKNLGGRGNGKAIAFPSCCQREVFL